MSYYILPKINNTIRIHLVNSDINVEEPYISHSLFKYYNELEKEIKINCNNVIYNYNDMIKIINPFEYVYTNVPGSKFSVSKLNPKTNMFYELLEVLTTLNLYDQYTKEIESLHISNNYGDVIECGELLRENYNDNIDNYTEINNETTVLIHHKKYDFLFFESSVDDHYIVSLIKILLIILKNQQTNGTCIIKISTIFYKPIVEILYILCSLFQKVYIMKPNVSNITTFDKYIICKNFQNKPIHNLETIYNSLHDLLKKIENIKNKYILSILDHEIPYYFITKINDINTILGNQQLESFNLVINLLKNKNKEEKIQIIKKTCIQKSVLWCEKFKIPCNKFSEKINIFLPIVKEFKELKEE
jgi:hypothetical protein